MHNLKVKLWECYGGPVVKALHVPWRGPGFEHSLLGEIRSYKACGTAKNKYSKLNYNNEYAGKDYAPI